MSDSIHITIKNFRNLTKTEVEEQYNDPKSELVQWAKKSSIKRNVRKSRIEKKQIEQLRKINNNNNNNSNTEK